MNALVNNEVPPSVSEDFEDALNLHDERSRLVLERREGGSEDIPPGCPIQVRVFFFSRTAGRNFYLSHF
jgi:hypothetical protein